MMAHHGSVLGMGMVTTGAPPPMALPGYTSSTVTIGGSSQYKLELADVLKAKNAFAEWKRDQEVKAEKRAAELAAAGSYYPKKKKREPAIRWSEAEETALREGMVKYGKEEERYIMIKRDPIFGEVLINRTNVNLKDKWRALTDKQPDLLQWGGPSGKGRGIKVGNKPPKKEKTPKKRKSEGAPAPTPGAVEGSPQKRVAKPKKPSELVAANRQAEEASAMKAAKARGQRSSTMPARKRE